MMQQCKEARQSVHKERLCHGSASAFPHDSRPVSWGLPTAACRLDDAASRFWLIEFPAKHARWKREGRVLIHCDRSALGNYMRALPTALLVSVLLELALVLECDQANPEAPHGARHQRFARLPLSEYFRSPHIDWHRGRIALSDRAAVLDLNSVFYWGTRKKADTSNDGLQPGLWPAVRMFTDAAHQTSRLLNPGNLRNFAPRLAGLLSNWSGVALVAQHALHHASKLGDSSRPASARRQRIPSMELPDAGHQLNGCLLRYLLAPTRKLQRAFDALSPLPRRDPRQPGDLLRLATLYARLGDSVFHPNQSWPFRRDRRGEALRRSPAAIFRCLLSSLEDGLGGCMQSAVLSDSTIVTEQCARPLLEQPTLSPGVPVHPMASPDLAVSSNEQNVLKYFLDWHLLTRSTGLITAGETSSSFFHTARALRDASGSGWVVVSRGHAGDVCRNPAANRLLGTAAAKCTSV